MTKHKKTRKEKIIADYRHQVYVLKNSYTPPTNSPVTLTVNANSYLNTHVFKDVLKTGILTCSIITMQIVLFLLLKKHLIILPMLKY